VTEALRCSALQVIAEGKTPEMSAGITIRRATADDVRDVAAMVGELLAEIMNVVGMHAFNLELDETTSRLKDFLNREKYFVFVGRSDGANAAGFISLYESYALYAEGAFGTIPELYVRPLYRGNKLGRQLLSQAKSFGESRGWTRLEVTTPPLPQFARTLAFYEREGFSITGGRKLKVDL
jgi:GNAT superfamily N-acetyltransferase